MQNLYGSLNRLQNFPLDKTSVYETKTLLAEYLANDKRAYDGQLLCVYNDSNKNNNGLYIARTDSVSQSKKSIKIADDDTVATLTESLDSAKTDIEAIQAQLPSYATLDITTSLRNDLNTLIGGTAIAETMDSIKEISDWIETHNAELENIDLIKTTLTNLSSTVSALQTSINSIQTTISSLGNIYVTKDELSSYNFTHTRRLEVLNILSSSENRSQTTFDSTCMIESIELDISSAANFSGEIIFEALESDGTFTQVASLVSTDEIFLSEIERYSYDMINYSVTSSGKIRFVCSANNLAPGTLEGKLYIHYVKLN